MLLRPFLITWLTLAGTSATEPLSLDFPHPQGLVWDATRDCFWVTNHYGGLFRMDTGSGSVTRAADIRSGAQGLTYDGQLLWYFVKDDPNLYAIDPETGSETGFITTPVTRHTGVAWDGESFWIVSRCASAAGQKDLIVRLVRHGDSAELDPDAQTESPQPLDNPGQATTALFWLEDRIYCSGETGHVRRGRWNGSTFDWDDSRIFEIVLSGGSSQGIAWNGESLHVIDSGRHEIRTFPLGGERVARAKVMARRTRSALVVALLGSEHLDVNTIDLASLRISNLEPSRFCFDDVDPQDGKVDLVLEFDRTKFRKAQTDDPTLLTGTVHGLIENFVIRTTAPLSW